MSEEEVIETLSDLRGRFSCFDEAEEPYYRALSIAIGGLKKASKKLAYVHERIDIYDDRPDTHDEDYWLTYLTDPEWGDTDIGWEAVEE